MLLFQRIHLVVSYWIRSFLSDQTIPIATTVHLALYLTEYSKNRLSMQVLYWTRAGGTSRPHLQGPNLIYPGEPSGPLHTKLSDTVHKWVSLIHTGCKNKLVVIIITYFKIIMKKVVFKIYLGTKLLPIPVHAVRCYILKSLK